MARSNPNQLKVKAFRRGQLAEYIAALYLLLKGYRILAVRYKTYLGEVDLIVKKQDLIIFVEVKARKSAQLAIDAVGTNSQKRIEAAARIWLSKKKMVLLTPIDLISLRSQVGSKSNIMRMPFNRNNRTGVEKKTLKLSRMRLVRL